MACSHLHFGYLGHLNVRQLISFVQVSWHTHQAIRILRCTHFNYCTCAMHTDRIPAKKEPCLTPTLMDEGQARNPNTTYNGYKMEFWKFALTWKLICPVQHKITQKEQKETTKKGGISLTIMGQRQTYNSIHKPQRSPNETLGFNQDDHPYGMCNETGSPEFLELPYGRDGDITCALPAQSYPTRFYKCAHPTYI